VVGRSLLTERAKDRRQSLKALIWGELIWRGSLMPSHCWP